MIIVGRIELASWDHGKRLRKGIGIFLVFFFLRARNSFQTIRLQRSRRRHNGS